LAILLNHFYQDDESGKMQSVGATFKKVVIDVEFFDKGFNVRIFSKYHISSKEKQQQIYDGISDFVVKMNSIKVS
jgi:hypothetical protein